MIGRGGGFVRGDVSFRQRRERSEKPKKGGMEERKIDPTSLFLFWYT